MDDGVEMKGGGGDTSWGGGSDPGGGALATSQRGVENLLTLESDASCEFRSLNIWLEETSQRSPPPSPLGHSTNDDNPLELLNVVLVASVDGKFHALNCLTGAKLWSMPSSPPPSSAPHGSAAAQSVPSILEPLVSTKHLDFSTRWVGHLMWGNFAPASPDNWLCAMYFE
ncbi:hypothetical protein BGW80DRAFT_1457837 [Lactifluus volemus]|nr:hypothetical protein BGW80DRAFT_1457837 [Lactifluus volemus]